ncbi:GDSL esterase/lipase At5g41890-like [Dioscorea cayenensis subsp. rotundata]|uniref:GDSL esterase/lipase At5g41890-like n=1 Tax=Dioscorea cayennensis subsp. rotundata TaxID=55577 RepID=A0AB40ASJ6_DIOCR|nr:GDSL esterase/lipase At5g41890-like [Dioscorea cayenensis subsp. rotundata]
MHREALGKHEQWQHYFSTPSSSSHSSASSLLWPSLPARPTPKFRRSSSLVTPLPTWATASICPGAKIIPIISYHMELTTLQRTLVTPLEGTVMATMALTSWHNLWDSKKAHHLSALLIDNNTCEIDITRAMKGLNFASGGSRLLVESSDGVISMTDQVKCFRKFRSQLTTPYPLLSESLFLISIGDNDIGAFLNETYHKMNDTDFNIFIEIQSFISNLTATYRNHIMDLYLLGGRKFGIVNVAPTGCIPVVKDRLNFTAGGCSNIVNAVSFACNYALEILMNNLSSTLTGMKYSIGNSYAVFMKIIDNPGAYGFKNVTDPCCGSALYGCNKTATVCSDRSQYVFWDNVHPTNATAKVFGNFVYDGSTEYASPINFKELVEDYNELTSVY